MNDWFYARNGQQNGPVTLEKLKELARTGGLDAKDLVWTGSMKDWTPAGQVEGIFTSTPADTSAPAADPSNPYAAPQSNSAEPATDSGVTLSEITPGSEPIDPTACVKRGFELTKRKFGDILLIGVVYFGITVAAAAIMATIDSVFGLGETTTHSTWHMGDGNMGGAFNQTHTASPLNALVTNLLSIFLTLGLTRVALNLVSGKAVSVGMLFGEGRKFLRAIGASILFGLMVGFGLLLLIVPGIYLALRYGQFLVAIVDRDMGIMEAFSYSSSITTNNKLHLIVLWLLSLLVIVAGLLACGIGLVFAIPVVWLAAIVAYRWMQYGHRAAMDQPGTVTPMLAGQ